MYSLVFLAITSFVLSLLLTPLVRNIARRLKLVDYPDAARKVHCSPIPRVGGIAISVTYVVSFAVLLVAHLRGAHVIISGLPLFWRLAPAALLIFGTGLLDDLLGLKPWQKLAGQLAAAIAACAGGVQIGSFGGHVFSPWIALPVTVFWLIACTNAFNLIDGVDGLAAGVGLFATITMLLAALLQNNVALALATVPLAGALLGFLRFNFNPATIFLGDSGSLLIGFLLGCYGVLWSEKSATILGMTAPLMTLAIPLLDTSLAIARRFLRQQPIFGADRGHIHHRLLDRGFTPRKVVLTLYAACGLFATMSLLTMWSPNVGIVIVLFCACTWIGIQHLGYLEFGVAGRMFMDGAFRRLLNCQISLQQYEQQLLGAATPDECWEIISKAAREYGFHRAHMTLAGREFHFEDSVEPLHSWQVRIPINDYDAVQLTRSFATANQSNIIAPFVEMVRRNLGAKLPTFARMPVASTYTIRQANTSAAAAGSAE